MAEVSDDFLRFTPSSLPSLCMDSAMESIAQFEELNAYVLDTPLFNLHGVMDFSNDTIHQPKFPDNLLGFPATNDQNLVPVSHSMACMGDGNQESETMKKATGIEEGDKTMRKNSFLRRKKRRCDEKQQEIPKGVVHVRARRGQATDSHSLAERVRREKINERMRCLQDLVPGCYKTKGMALMLDEIINYVHSLQNQVEFLSMKLSAASSFYDFSSDMEFTETRQADQHHNFTRL